MLVAAMNGKRSLDFAAGDGPLTKKARLNGLDLSGKSSNNGNLFDNEFIVRRLASMKAQVALASFYSIAESPTRSHESYIFSDGKGEMLACGDIEDVSASLQGCGAYTGYRGHTAVTRSRGQHTNGRYKLRSSSPYEPPESPLSSVLSEEENSSPLRVPAVRESVCVFDSKGCSSEDEKYEKKPLLKSLAASSPGSGEKRASNECRLSSPLSPSVVDNKTGYVKRLASLNARACVTALIEPEKKFIPKCCRSPQKSSAVITSGSTPPPSSTAGIKHSSNADVELRDFSLGIVKCQSPSPQQQRAEDGDLDAVPFNTLGLLYNGDTIHPQYPFYLDSQCQLPERIVPVVLPATLEGVWQSVQRAKEQFKQAKRRLRATKGNNGWSTIGDPIKNIQFTQEGTAHSRKYFAGIRRRNEEVFVRDCVTIRSGGKKNEKPYVAKIASIWQEPGGCLMCNLFWYYRPGEMEVVGTSSLASQPDELFASQHHDENSVACIEEKCFVLGLRSYCRYRSSVSRQSLVPRLQSLVKFNSNCEVVITEQPSSDIDPHLVYLCCQGYNHLTGKIAR